MTPTRSHVDEAADVRRVVAAIRRYAERYAYARQHDAVDCREDLRVEQPRRLQRLCARGVPLRRGERKIVAAMCYVIKRQDDER